MFRSRRDKSRILRQNNADYEDGNPALGKLDDKNSRFLEFSEFLEWYDAHRRYIESEGNLINHRVGWVLSIHGFLYASYGLVLASQTNQIFTVKGGEVSSSLADARCGVFFQSEMYLYGISIIGMAISLFGTIGVSMAHSTMRVVSRSFRIQNRVRVLYRDRPFSRQESGVPHFRYKKNPIRYLIRDGISVPGLTGGGSKRNSKWGSRTSILIPAALAFGWLISLLVLSKSSSINLEFACGHNTWEIFKSYVNSLGEAFKSAIF